MLRTLNQIRRVGCVSEPAPEPDEALREREAREGLREREAQEGLRVRDALQQQVLELLGRALCIRAVDAGSCNGCELEIHALNNPRYNIEGAGIRFVASPRHADLLLVTGPVARHMECALRRTYDATPDPKLVVAVGDCGCTGGLFGTGYATLGPVSRVLPVDVAVPGCPPSPTALLKGILTAVAVRRP